MTETLGRYPKSKRVLARLGAMAVVVGGIYGIGYAVGNPTSEAPTINVALERAVRPTAIKIGQQVLNFNLQYGPREIVTHPDPWGNGSEVVEVESWTPSGDWVVVDATMDRDKNGQLNPSTTYDVDISIRGCSDTKDLCGGRTLPFQELDLTLGDSTTFTKGDWGIKDTDTPSGYANPTMTLSSTMKNPNEVSTDSDAKHALREARIWVAYAQAEMDEVWQGQTKVPQLQDIASSHLD